MSTPNPSSVQIGDHVVVRMVPVPGKVEEILEDGYFVRSAAIASGALDVITGIDPGNLYVVQSRDDEARIQAAAEAILEDWVGDPNVMGLRRSPDPSWRSVSRRAAEVALAASDRLDLQPESVR